MRQTPLHDRHEALGARMVDFAGWHMPVQYGPILDEVRRVREACGLFDLGHMGRISVRGPERVAFLERLATCHVAAIPEGAIRYGLFCREDGGPIDDLLVHVDPEELFLVVNAANAEADLAWMREHAAGFAVEIEDRTEELGMIALQGPASRAVLEPLLDELDLGALRYYRSGPGRLCGIAGARVARTGYTGELGYELYLPAGRTVEVWQALLDAGRPLRLAPIGLGARDTLRLEAGMALYGHEIDPEHDPIQAGLSFAVSFAPEKGDWIGRAALQRIARAPRRRLVGLTTPGPRIPRQGQAVLRGDAELGQVCSGSRSPTLDTNIATAYVPVAIREGESLELDFRGKRQPALVVPLPFYSRTRT
jgi:aminomethyltransferase